MQPIGTVYRSYSNLHAVCPCLSCRHWSKAQRCKKATTSNSGRSLGEYAVCALQQPLGQEACFHDQFRACTGSCTFPSNTARTRKDPVDCLWLRSSARLHSDTASLCCGPFHSATSSAAQICRLQSPCPGQASPSVQPAGMDRQQNCRHGSKDVGLSTCCLGLQAIPTSKSWHAYIAPNEYVGKYPKAPAL